MVDIRLSLIPRTPTPDGLKGRRYMPVPKLGKGAKLGYSFLSIYGHMTSIMYNVHGLVLSTFLCSTLYSTSLQFDSQLVLSGPVHSFTLK